ncbi:hypothetical protein HNV08_09055 [Winogradskyella eckloniae]|uniref:hypothetical protein n=1 Tax=Winogradskyella eckloniae TaxID=1089306 RepID=UPI001564827A|nr:hypothetical protein [Winogradskyella eckloniae]NRD20197.1 hypothetical protein [Winogradskyella eckloniae]
MKNIVTFILLSVVLTSCTTILNGRTTRVNIYADQNSKVEYKSEELPLENGTTTIYPFRSNEPLEFTISNDSISTDIRINREISSLIYLNIPYTYGLGILVDLTNDKRFTYRRNLFLEIDSTANRFKIFEGKARPFKQHQTFIYTSPLMAMDVFSQPQISLGVEYFPLNNLSFSAEYSTVYTERLGSSSRTEFFENKGRSFRYELKYYNLTQFVRNPKVNEYLGFEARFVRYQYNKSIEYYRNNENINYYVKEQIAVQKSLDIFNIKYGLNFPVGKQMYIDLYTGFGIRNKTFANPNIKYNAESDQLIDDDRHFLFFGQNNYLEGVHDRKLFNFSLGFKFGVKL